jgi:predicted nucleotidyltransferase component of viral defense system
MLAFKGGTAIKRCYFGDYRFSEDLDFTLTGEISFEGIRQGLEPIFEETRRSSGVAHRFSREDRQSHANSHTFYLGYEGPLPARENNEVKVDITIRERIVIPLEDRPVVRGYEEYEDLPDDAFVRAYSLNEIAVEKIVALTDRARTEPRDLYDIWYLTSTGNVDLGILVPDIQGKLEFRGRTLSDVGPGLLGKEDRLNALWSGRLDAQMTELPEFEGVFRAVHRTMRQAGLTG